MLDIASGRGRHTRLFLDRGHPVTSIDVNVTALVEIGEHPALYRIAADLESPSPWPIAGQFAAVVVTNYLWRPRLPDIVAAVADGGVLLYETFAIGNAALGRPANPDYLLQPGELLAAVTPNLQIVAYEHGRVAVPGPAIVQRICAMRATAPGALS